MRVGILRDSGVDFGGDSFQVPFELRQRPVVILRGHLDGLLEVLGCGVQRINRLFLVSDGKEPIEDQRKHGPQCNARDVHPRHRQTLHA